MVSNPTSTQFRSNCRSPALPPYHARPHTPANKSPRRAPAPAANKDTAGYTRPRPCRQFNPCATVKSKRCRGLRQAPKNKTKYKLTRYKLDKNQVTCSKPKPKLNAKPEDGRAPWLKRPFACQQNAPGNTVKFATATANPACSIHVKPNPASMRKSDTPEYRRIRTPNQTKVHALLQQQNTKRYTASLYRWSPRATMT